MPLADVTSDAALASSRRNRIRTILHDDQIVLPGELDLLHTPSLQRLYDLHQLGLADRVYIDASHSRLHHVVGVLEHVDKINTAIVNNLRTSPRKLFRYGPKAEHSITGESLADRVEDDRPITRLIGLLHDLTHAPYGHTVEDELHLIASRHDEPQRQADACYRLLCEYIRWLAADADAPGRAVQVPADLIRFLQDLEAREPSPQVLGNFAADLFTTVSPESQRAAWRLNAAEIRTLLVNLRVSMTALLHLELLHNFEPEKKHFPDPDGTYDFQKVIDVVLGRFYGTVAIRHFDPHLDAYMLDIVGNTVCADLMDYAKRDARQANIKLDFDADRIAENFTVVSCDETYDIEGQAKQRKIPTDLSDPFSGSCLRTAISLYSHKLRTDVPTELMNLLNIRFYLFERAIYHPTKCAAGAMLGTALQLIGWRHADKSVDQLLKIVNQPSTDKEPSEDLLPPRLRQVGDAVFLHDVEAGARLAIRVLRKEVDIPTSIADVPQLVLAQDLVQRGVSREGPDKPISRIIEEIEAGIQLLSRLKARRYLQAIFRVLPNLQDQDLRVDAERMAEVFRRPEVRYKAERMIEDEAGLPCGSVAIHCPRAKVAEKIANALLVMPNGLGQGETICQLHGISKLDPNMFGKHESAITAVEQMYHSMWRLVVYASPRSRADHAAMNRAIGRVLSVFAVTDTVKNRFPDRVLQNDRMFEKELEDRLKPTAVVQTITVRHPVEGRIRLSPAVVDAGRALLALRPDLFARANGTELTGMAEWRRQLAAAMPPQSKTRPVPGDSRGGRKLINVVVKMYGELDAPTREYVGGWEKSVFQRLPAAERATVFQVLSSDHQRKGPDRRADLARVKKDLDSAVRRAKASTAAGRPSRPDSSGTLF